MSITDELSVEEYVEKTFAHLKTIRAPWEQLWQNVLSFVIPLLEDWTDTKRGKQFGNVYDSRPISILTMAAEGVFGSLINPTAHWWDMKPAKSQLQNDEVFRRWLQDIVVSMYDAIQRSNFYTVMLPFIKHGLSLGTSTLLMEEDVASGRIVFIVPHPREIYLAENRFGEVDTVYREYPITLINYVDRFGKEKLPESYKTRYLQTPYAEIKILHAIYPRKNFDPNIKEGKGKKWASNWYCNILPKESRLIEENGSDFFPGIVWRYETSGNEVYGRSPCMDAFADMAALNLIRQDLEIAGQLSARPPINIPPSMRDKTDISPHGLNYFDDPNSKLEFVRATGEYPIAKDREELVVAIIERHLKVDVFTMLAKIDREMTAYEVAQRLGENAMRASSMTNRLTKEGIEPTLDKIFQIEKENGRLPPQPMLPFVGKAPTTYNFLGPLAQMQQIIFKGLNLESGVNAVLPLVSSIGQEVVVGFKWRKIAQEIMRVRGVLDIFFATEEEALAALQEMVKAQQAAAAPAAQETQARAIRNVAQSVKMAGGLDKLQQSANLPNDQGLMPGGGASGAM